MARSPDVRGGLPHAAVSGAVLDGWRRVLRAPAIWLGVLVATFLLALPLAVVVERQVDANRGASAVADREPAGRDTGWAGELGADARGFGQTVTHEILGFGGTLRVASELLDQTGVPLAVAGAVAAYLGLWLFLWGGILDRYARARPVRTAAFFAACGVYFVRFLRLAIPVGLAYGVILRGLQPWLFGSVYPRLTSDPLAETDAVPRLALYGALVVALLLVRVVADVAMVRAVVEDRRSMLGALAASWRFVRRRPVRVLALYAASAAALAAVLIAWRFVGPATEAPVWLALVLAQVYLLGRLWVRLALAASLVVFYQRELAHATYTAAPLLVWPDSPAAEALDNLNVRAGVRRQAGRAGSDDP